MPVFADCSCGYSGSVPDNYKGQKVMCPKCGNMIVAGGGSEEQPPAQEPAAPPPEMAPPPMPGADPVGAGNTKTCPFCQEMIPVTAVKCPKCGEVLDPNAAPIQDQDTMRMGEDRQRLQMQIDADEKAKTAFWISVVGFCCIGFLGPVGFILGLTSFAKGQKAGSVSGYSIAAIILGGLATAYTILLVIGWTVGGLQLGNEVARQQGEAQCKSNLKSVNTALQGYIDDNEGAPDSTGKDLWQELVDGGYLRERSLLCPLTDDDEGRISYRGPLTAIYDAGLEDPIACDEPGNHDDGSIHILYNDGTVRRVKKDSSDYDDAMDLTD